MYSKPDLWWHPIGLLGDIFSKKVWRLQWNVMVAAPYLAMESKAYNLVDDFLLRIYYLMRLGMCLDLSRQIFVDHYRRNHIARILQPLSI